VKLRFGRFEFGDVSPGAAISQEPALRIEEWIAADRSGPFPAGVLPSVNKIAERLTPFQRGNVFLPFGGITAGVDRQLQTGAADDAAGLGDKAGGT
jgi:hypothetical protein